MPLARTQRVDNQVQAIYHTTKGTKCIALISGLDYGSVYHACPKQGMVRVPWVDLARQA